MAGINDPASVRPADTPWLHEPINAPTAMGRWNPPEKTKSCAPGSA